MSKPLVWLIGSPGDPCFAPAIDWLAEQFELRRFDNVAESQQQSSQPPEPLYGAVFCSVRPGQFDAAAVEALHRSEPHARLVLLLGSWCEGEVRSGSVIAGVKRIYWHQWRGLLPLALGRTPEGEERQPLPRTASEADWLEATLSDTAPQGKNLLVAVCTARAATFDWLADALTRGGFHATWQRPDRPMQIGDAQVIVWDGWPSDSLRSDDNLARIGQVLLLDFPRPEDRQRALELGVTELVSRPCQLITLWDAVSAAAQREAPRPSVAEIA